MYHIIDTCYGQNFGLEEGAEDSEVFSLVLAGERRLDAQKLQILRGIHLCIYDSLLQPQDVEGLRKENLTVERFLNCDIAPLSQHSYSPPCS